MCCVNIKVEILINTNFGITILLQIMSTTALSLEKIKLIIFTCVQNCLTIVLLPKATMVLLPTTTMMLLIKITKVIFLTSKNQMYLELEYCHCNLC